MAGSRRALWDEWQPRLSPEEWPLPILGMLATAGSQSLEEITNALKVTRFEVLGALNAVVIAARIGERRYAASRTYR
jgi:hypothetical protein